MKLIIHFPGKLHKELNKKIEKPMSFYDILSYLSHKELLFSEYLDEDKFFSRFITIKNGKRFYDFDIKCNKNDFIIIVAANKIKNINNIYEKNELIIKKCEECGKQNVAFIDDSILTKYKKRALCINCFKQKMKEKIYDNIKHVNLKENSIIDFGISGERDSTVALYYLTNYRKMNNIKFKINCVFNAVGLGNYDKIRMDAAKKAFEEFCGDEDSFKVNNLDLNFESDYKENKKNISIFSNKYCSICTRANGFREYGEYNGKDIYTASGSNTIEDSFANKIMNKGQTFPTTIINSNFPKANNFRRILILNGILEDMISIFAALENINYCVADCPLANISPNYLCRENALNLIKAKTNWISSSYGDIKLTENSTILGKISSERKVEYKNKCISLDNKNTYGVKELTVTGIVDSIKNKLKPDELEKSFYNICCDSKQKYLENNFEKYFNLFSSNYIKNLNVELNDVLIQKIENIYFMIHKHQDYIEPLNVTDLEMKYIYIIEKNGKIKIKNLLSFYYNIDIKIKIKALQNLIISGIIKLNLPNQEIDKKERLLYVIDPENLINNTYYKIIQDIFEVKKKNIYLNQESVLLSANKEDIILIIENDSYKIKDYYERLKSISAEVIYVHVFNPITIFTNDYSYIEKNWNIDIEHKSELLKNEKSKCRLQIISALNEIMLCDFNTIKNRFKNYNVLYYINLTTGEKKKQLF